MDVGQCQNYLAKLIVTGIQQLMYNEIKVYWWFQPITFLMLNVHCTTLTIYILLILGMHYVVCMYVALGNGVFYLPIKTS